MKNINLDLLKNIIESWDIYQTLCNSESMFWKSVELELENIDLCLYSTLEVLLTDKFLLSTGSAAEGTHITSEDYGKRVHSTLGYISDEDIMYVWCFMQVIDEGVTLPQRFDNHIYCQAERGEHTTDGFRKLRVIHSPKYYSPRKENFAHIINKSVEYAYISSSTFLARTVNAVMYSTAKQSFKTGLGTQGPSQILERKGSALDLVTCFYVKTWPKEAGSWFTRQTHWPDRKLKSKIRKTGYLLVPTGNSNSQERDLEWRCSFSIAEKILFQSMTTFQICTFILLKVLLKEYLPSDINTDSEKQLLSTYHMKTLFLWSLEDSKIEWEPENMLDILDHLLDELSGWLNRQKLPHYFIPSVNLLDSKRLHGREKALICCISTIRNDLSNKIKLSQFFMGQETKQFLASNLDDIDRCLSFINIHHYVMQSITATLQAKIHIQVFVNLYTLRELNITHSVLIEGLISIKPEVDPQMQHLYRAVYSDPVHDKLLTEVVPGLIDQYRGCIHLAKYCMAARDGRVLPGVLHTAESLLKDTLHLDPCSGYVKLACFYIATDDFVEAMDKLHVAENSFLFIHKNMKTSDLRNLQLNGVEVDRLSTEFYTIATQEIFQEWAEGQVTSDIVVTWLEYISVPDFLQFELIHESTEYVTDDPCSDGNGTSKMVGLDCRLQWPPLSMIKLLKFVCAFNSGRSSKSHMINLVGELSLSFTACGDVNDKYTVINMAAWCYLKIKKYRRAAHMMIVAIGSSSESEVIKRCAFSYHFLAYAIGHFLAIGSRVLVYKKDNVSPKDMGKRVLVYKKDNVWP